MAKFRDEVSRYPGTECLSARDGAEAAELISRIAGDSKSVVLNRSATVANELKPRLLELGFQVIEPYHSELGDFENRDGRLLGPPVLCWRRVSPPVLNCRRSIPAGAEASDEEARKDCVAYSGSAPPAPRMAQSSSCSTPRTYPEPWNRPERWCSSSAWTRW